MHADTEVLLADSGELGHGRQIFTSREGSDHWQCRWSRSLAAAVAASPPPDQTVDLQPPPVEIQQQAEMQVAGFGVVHASRAMHVVQCTNRLQFDSCCGPPTRRSCRMVWLYILTRRTGGEPRRARSSFPGGRRCSELPACWQEICWASGNRVGGSGRIGGKRRVSMRDPHAIGSGCRCIGVPPYLATRLLDTLF